MGEPKKTNASAVVVSIFAALMLVGSALYLMDSISIKPENAIQQIVLGIRVLAGSIWFCASMVIFAIQSK